ncbi:uncharacterized protein MICPUCDRAFT_54824 [Micromonas pusilla CCMP1545]|uniref:Predicted protein n=1 Tax=Micromonas pusilla (strain CCMP1545) TaxID=564608 RepID=C1NAA9_MICPC|nr:uncharacterized protein MICPUCDRAFT_54824 [Micromonas pusilla CCMP1545]EEH50911.1 predicted protein [Micromonas pusilla CCMP1545]|eukprot:XP_003064931.1 predicted protein [Micromonas pusilla CCMP1545]
MSASAASAIGGRDAHRDSAHLTIAHRAGVCFTPPALCVSHDNDLHEFQEVAADAPVQVEDERSARETLRRARLLVFPPLQLFVRCRVQWYRRPTSRVYLPVSLDHLTDADDRENAQRRGIDALNDDFWEEILFVRPDDAVFVSPEFLSVQPGEYNGARTSSPRRKSSSSDYSRRRGGPRRATRRVRRGMCPRCQRGRES